MSETDAIRKIIETAESVVFFGGAGVSTASGIPDFRGNDGLYRQQNEEQESPEALISHGCLFGHPERFFAYYKSHMLYPHAEPNDAHVALARLEQAGKLQAVVTQNIDGLHQRAGSKRVIELHGSAMRNYCVRCGKSYDLDFVASCDTVPRCTCGGMVRPDVVLYGEALDSSAWSEAEAVICEADVLLVGGTSLTVYPAASLLDCFEGEHLVIINRSPTPYDGLAEYVIRDSVASVLPRLL